MSKTHICLIFILAFLSFLSCQLVTNNVQWTDNWAFGCDFVGNDLSSARVSGNLCGSLCAQTKGCTHFTWTSWNGGTCWMKSGNTCKNKAVQTLDMSTVCGVIKESFTGCFIYIKG